MSITDQLLDLLAYATAEQHDFITTLPATERDAAGTADRWSAKDNVSHVVEWNLRLIERLEAAARGEAPPAQGEPELNQRTR